MKALVISCADYRLGDTPERVLDYLRQQEEPFLPPAGVKLYRIQCPGPDGVITGARGDMQKEAMFQDIALLIDKGDVEAIILVGHYGCAGHHVSNARHDDDCREAANILTNYCKLPVLALVDVPVDVSVNGADRWELRELHKVAPRSALAAQQRERHHAFCRKASQVFP